jgi:hypothetical protein
MKTNQSTNIKDCILKGLSHSLVKDKTILCMTTSIGSNSKREYDLKRGYITEEFDKYLQDVNFTIYPSSLTGIIIWYQDGSYSWAGDEEDHITWEHHRRPNPDSFNL